MFIKPVDVESLPAGVWNDNSGNLKFSLQSRSSTKSLFKMMRKEKEYDYRVIMRSSGKNAFVIAVDDTFEKIHDTWNWIELNIMPKVLHRV
jgi:hypothetical protein